MLPRLIQGGMGIGVSGWTLAAEVARLGQLGVVSGTALDSLLVRRWASEPPDGPVHRAVAAFPTPAVAQRLLDRFLAPDPGDRRARYKLLPLVNARVSPERAWLLVLASFVEVHLAKLGHAGVVGINFLRKVQNPLLPSLYGAMLAGVDVVLIGAGIPGEIPAILDRLAEHRDVEMRVDGLDAETTSFSPASLWLAQDPTPPTPTPPTPTPPTPAPPTRAPLRRPHFLAIVSSATLARSLLKRAPGGIAGFVIEAPNAGGHNAPPRGLQQLSVRGEPVYGARDEVDLEQIRAMGVPFWLAGGYASRDRVHAALAAGARGVQVGTAFAFCRESGLEESLRARFLQRIRQGRADVFTDPDASPTNFPFKVAALPGTLSDRDVFDARPRQCDLGYLRTAYRKPDGSVGFRCPAEPVDDYVQKGGRAEDTAGRKCLCNALLANVGLGQRRADGYDEPPLLTAGSDLACVAVLAADRDSYSAKDVVDSLLG